MPHDSPLSRSVGIHRRLKQRLIDLYDLEEDDPTLIDTLEGVSDLNEAIVQILREARYAGSQAEALKGLISEMGVRKERFERKEASLRNSATWAMEESGLSRIDAPDMTITVRPGKPKLIIDDDRLPQEFKKARWSPDKALVQAAVDHGNVPEGVEIANGGSVLTVRGK